MRSRCQLSWYVRRPGLLGFGLVLSAVWYGIVMPLVLMAWAVVWGYLLMLWVIAQAWLLIVGFAVLCWHKARRHSYQLDWLGISAHLHIPYAHQKGGDDGWA